MPATTATRRHQQYTPRPRARPTPSSTSSSSSPPAPAFALFTAIPPRVRNTITWLRRPYVDPYQQSTLFLLLVFTAVFAVTAHYCHIRHLHFNDRQLPFVPGRCTLIIKRVPNVDASCPDPARSYRLDLSAIITNPSFSSSDALPLYVTERASPCVNKTAFDSFNAAYANKGNTTVDCFYSSADTPPLYVLLVPGSYADKYIASARTRFIIAVLFSTVFAFVILKLLYQLTLHSLFPDPDHALNPHRRHRGANASTSTSSSSSSNSHSSSFDPVAPLPIASTQPRPRRALHARDAALLVSALAHDLFRDKLDANDEKHPLREDATICSICLEDFIVSPGQDEQGATNKRIRLPCGHLFHEQCTLQWLRKGAPSCPYCFYDLAQDLERARKLAPQAAHPRGEGRVAGRTGAEEAAAQEEEAESDEENSRSGSGRRHGNGDGSVDGRVRRDSLGSVVFTTAATVGDGDGDGDGNASTVQSYSHAISHLGSLADDEDHVDTHGVVGALDSQQDEEDEQVLSFAHRAQSISGASLSSSSTRGPVVPAPVSVHVAP